MNKRQARFTCLAALTAAFLIAAGWMKAQTHGAKKRTAATRKIAAPSPFACSGNVTVTFGPTVPGDGLLSAQSDSDCFGWAEFVALNWPASGSGFGNPADLRAVQWETYMQAELMYPPNGAKPPPWGSTGGAIPSGCQVSPSLRAEVGRKVRILKSASKLVSSTGEGFTIPGIQQAYPQNAPAWLGAQSAGNVWYEVILNKDIYDFVTAPSNQFYNATMQDSKVNDGTGEPIVFPKGSLTGSPTGAIEMKAAWMEVPNYNPAAPGKWAKYKLSTAVVIGPTNNQCRTVTVALVGLHIIHKTGSQPTWIWATFEHVDNVPGPNQTSDCCNFNATSCQTRQVTVPEASCLGPGQTSPVTVSCTPNTSPPYYLGPGCPAPVPIQITRTVQLDSNATAANQAMWTAIGHAYPTSVFRYYQLVDVLWSTNPTQDPTLPQKVPLNPHSLTSGNPGRVFNTTLESYFQSSQCTDCHRYATIAPQSANLPWDSDFSFAFGTASPATAGLSSRASRRIKPVRY